MKKRLRVAVAFAFITGCYDFSLPPRDDGYDADASDAATGENVDFQSGGGGDNGLCGSGGLLCDSACVENDARNCGKCGHDCTGLAHVGGPVDCVNGACVLSTASCAPGWMHCSANPEEGCETDIAQVANCGKCGNNCPQTGASLCAQKQEDGSAAPSTYECVSKCPSNAATICDNSCVNTDSSPIHCGKCGVRCPETEPGVQATCKGSTCGTSCKEGHHECAGKCVSNKSPDSCGTSCEPCKAQGDSIASCDGSKCTYGCNAGYLSCDDKCVPSDEKNCGKCGYDCTALPNVSGDVSCKADACVVPTSSCAPGYAHCSKNPEDGCEIDLSKTTNCGGCLTKCSASELCLLKKGATETKPIYECGTKCETTAPTQCGTSCVNTTSNPSHCGQCNKECPKPEFGIAICKNGECAIECNSGYHQCEEVCVYNKSPDTCGTTECSTPCSDVDNATATCDGKTCGFTCNSDSKKCGSGCIKKSACCSNADCDTGNNEVCSQQTCKCDTGYKSCGSECIAKADCCASTDKGKTCSVSGTSGFCNSNGECVECASESDCSSKGLHCDDTGTCVECRTPSDCTGVTNAGCTSNHVCTGCGNGKIETGEECEDKTGKWTSSTCRDCKSVLYKPVQEVTCTSPAAQNFINVCTITCTSNSQCPQLPSSKYRQAQCNYYPSSGTCDLPCETKADCPGTTRSCTKVSNGNLVCTGY